MTHCPSLDRDVQTLPGALPGPLPAAPAVRPARPERSSRGLQVDSYLAPVLSMMAIVVLGVLCISLTRSAGLVAALWAPGGVAAATWLRCARNRNQDALFALYSTGGFLTANLMVGNPPLVSLVFTAANMIEVVGLVWLARRFAPHQLVNSVRGQLRFLAVAGLAPIASGIFAVTILSGLGLDHYQNQTASILIWWSGHAIGFAVVGGFLLSLRHGETSDLLRPARVAEAIGLTLVLAATCYLVFARLGLDAAFLILPVLALIAVRFRVAGVCLALAVVVTSAVIGALTVDGHAVANLTDRSAKMAATLVLLTLGCLPVSLMAALLNDNERLAAQERRARDKAEKASEAKSRLLANVAHEIKSPITGVIGLAQLWKGGQVPASGDNRNDMADMLLKTARQIETLSNDLLDMARAEAGMIRVEPRVTDTQRLLQDVAQTLRLRPDTSGLAIQVECPAGLMVLADPQRLEQVITNFAVNAVKYAASGGLVRLQATAVLDRICISVIDKGPGLSTQKQDELFEPFNRLGMERSAVEGHGIGLAVSRRLVELQGGSIGVRSELGQGAEFWVNLPAA
jgi:Signal transduction histidine kinase